MVAKREESMERSRLCRCAAEPGGGVCHLQFITLEPNALFLPVLLHSDMVRYANTFPSCDETGSGRLNRADENDVEEDRFEERGHLRATGGHHFPSPLITSAEPKSANVSCPRESKGTLSGLMSRWMTRWRRQWTTTHIKLGRGGEGIKIKDQNVFQLAPL